MSADFRTENYKGYLHHDKYASSPAREERSWIHVTQADHDSDYAIGDFTLADLAQLVEMAGQAWPGRPGVEVRYVIEARLPGREWQPMWSAPVSEDGSGDGVGEEFAQTALAGFRAGGSARMEWRLVQRTTLTADEVLPPLDGEAG
jgi:hypothetical protein